MSGFKNIFSVADKQYVSRTQNKKEEDPSVILCRWGIKWIKYVYNVTLNGTNGQQVAKILLDDMDRSTETPEELVEEHVEVKMKYSTKNGVRSEVGVVERKRKRLVKGGRSKFATALAKEAYVKFGARSVSQANVLVTRKWLLKLIEERFTDLRTCDKALAIDRAVYLSFIPTMIHNNTRILVDENPIKTRIDGEGDVNRLFRLACQA
jgi:hypothetical protein